MVASGPTSTQLGLIAENLVINALILASHGRLAPFRPVADDEGIDLLLYDKGTGRVLPLQVKARTRTLKKRGSSERGNIVHFQVREVALRQKGKTRLLAVLLDENVASITAAWLIPLNQMERVARKIGENFVIRPNRSIKSRDRFKPYFIPSIDVLVAKLMQEFERFDASFPPMSVLR
jgi:hypothetical protein